MKITGLILGLLITSALFAQSDKKYIREGNTKFENNNFDEAEIDYRKALDENFNSDKAKYNLGGSLYKQEKYEEAGKIYSEMAQLPTDKKELARYYHNLGNALFKANDYAKSVEAYKNALRNDPTAEDTRYNLVYAQKKLQQQQNQDQQNKDQDNKDQEQQQNKDQQQQNNEQQQDQPQNNEQQQQQQNEQNQQQQQQPQPQKAEISEEDARRLLEALENEEKQLQQKLMEQKAKSQKVKTEKNW